MSRFNRKQFRLDIGPHGCTLSLRSRGGWTLLDGVAAAPTADLGPAALQALVAARVPAGAQVITVIDDSLARFFMVRPPAQVATLHALRAIAALRFGALFGYPKHEWVLEGEWSATSPFFVCALPRALLAQINGVFASCKLDTLGTFPDSVWRWNAAAGRMNDDGAWFCHASAHHTLLAATRAGRIHAVSATSGPAPTTLVQLQAALMRESLRWDCAYPHTVYVAGPQLDAWDLQQCGGAKIVAIAGEGASAPAATVPVDVAGAPANGAVA